MRTPPEPDCCPGSDCESPQTGALGRRRFLSLTAALAGPAALPEPARAAEAGRHAIADALNTGGPGVSADDIFVVPADKRIPAEWSRDLTARGRPTSYRGAALANIGMPVGGGCAGQVYLGGDGRLWHWDIFNLAGVAADDPYRNPEPQSSPFRQGFALRTGGQVRALDSSGFDDVRFTGQYPIGRVDLRTDSLPVEVTLEAFSPFVPLRTDDSTLPATVLAYTLRNTSDRPVEAELIGWSENPVCPQSRSRMPTRLRSTGFRSRDAAGLEFSAALDDLPGGPRPDLTFEDWERPAYDGWTVEGTAFGSGPVLDAEVPGPMKWGGPLNVTGERFVTSFAYWQTEQPSDAPVGRLVSRPFTIERRYLKTRVGGGESAQTALRVLVDGAEVAAASGRNVEPMHVQVFDLNRWQGRTATIEIVDGESGSWGHVNVDDIVLTDQPEKRPLSELPDAGTFALAALDTTARVRPSVAGWSTPAEVVESGPGPEDVDAQSGQAGAVGVEVRIPPGQSRTIRFVVGWYFPVPDRHALSFLTGAETLKHHYSTRFGSAQDVVRALAADRQRLERDTRLWVRTFYADSTLPQWFLERTFSTASTLATMVCHRFADGRFYGWEGTYCCAGTCQHVWNYAQAIARLFPGLERDTRERVDLGIGFDAATGEMGHRAEAGMTWASDGQAGTVLRCYREHLTGTDDRFVKRSWPRLKRAIEFLIEHDAGPDGTLDGSQPNTLDTVWYGEIAWISSIYVAALYAGAELAAVAGDEVFGRRCRELADSGANQLSSQLWNGENFIQLTDPVHPESVNYNVGCHADQMLGQSLAWQIGRLPRVLPADQCRTALDRVYLYSFTPDAAGWREINTKIGFGRWFAVEDEHGVIMTTWPRGGAAQAPGVPGNIIAMYFNECWTGQEYQLAAHMIAEGLVEKGLLLVRAVHERYRAEKRNPYNEIECSEHYARAMASYGVFLTACGFELDGPAGHLGFAPRLGADDFAAAFTGADGWGLYRQRRRGRDQRSVIEVRHGRIEVSSLTLGVRHTPRTVSVRLGGRSLRVRETSTSDGRMTITLADRVVVRADRSLTVELD